MKTFDDKMLSKKIAEKYGKYPEGSLSPREIIMTVPMDYDEDLIQRVNQAITATLVNHAVEFVKNNPPAPRKQTFTPVPPQICYNDRRAADEESKKQLTQSIVNAVYSITSKK